MHLKDADEDHSVVQVHRLRHGGIGKDEFGVVRDDGEAGENLENKQAQTDQNGVPGYVGCDSI